MDWNIRITTIIEILYQKWKFKQLYKRGDGSNNCCPFLSGWLMRITSSTIRGLESDVEQEKPQYLVQIKDPESWSSNIHDLQVLALGAESMTMKALAIPGGLVIPWFSPLVHHFQTRGSTGNQWCGCCEHPPPHHLWRCLVPEQIYGTAGSGEKAGSLQFWILEFPISRKFSW